MSKAHMRSAPKRCLALAAAALLLGCDAKEVPVDVATYGATSAVPTSYSVPLAAGITLTTQDVLGVRQKIHARTLSVTPRPFGPFNLNGLNELRVEDAVIEIAARETGTEAASEPGSDMDVTTLLRDYFERERGAYGYIERLRIDGVTIRLAGAGRHASDVIVQAQLLVRDFNASSAPRLFNVTFADSQVPGARYATEVSWDTATHQFTVTGSPAVAAR